MATEKRLIDANDPIEKILLECNAYSQTSELTFAGLTIAKKIVEAAPTVDAVEVVRCKDCEYWFPENEERCKVLNTEPFGWCCRMRNMSEVSYREITQHKDFCSYGERRTDVQP